MSTTQRGDTIFAGEAGYFFQLCETAMAHTGTYRVHIDGDSGTELEIVKRDRVSMKRFMPECLY